MLPWVLIAALVGPASVAQAQATPTRNVVVLHEFEPVLPTTVQLARGLRSILERPGVVISSEYLDRSRFDTSAEARDLARWYAAKYADLHIDLIVAVGGQTLKFLLERRGELWSEVPIVFCAVFDNLGALPSLPAKVTGVTARFPVEETLDLALQLLPGTRRIALVSGTSQMDRIFARPFWEAIARYERKLEITDLSGMSYEEIRDRMAALPEDTVALGITLLRDGVGRQLPGPSAVEMITERSRVALFAMFDTVLGHGAVGGWLLSYEQMGREAAALAQRVLDGESPSGIPVVKSTPAHLEFDARQLDRWSIPRSRLPAGSEVMFSAPRPPLARPAVLFGLGLLMTFEAALIGALLLERRRRRRFERGALADRVRIAHMNRVAVVGKLAATLAHEVSAPIAAMLNDARAARRFLDSPANRLPDARASISAVEQHGERARDVLLQMRRVLRRESHEPPLSNLSQAVRDAARLVQSDAREQGVVIELALPDTDPFVRCSAVQLQQVLLNLMLNAVEAARGQSPERCRIKVDVLPRSMSAEVVVQDWGKGVSPEDQARLFEPYFTTKPDGLGMGLSISRSIVEEHGGRLSLVPHEIGAAFQFTLPLADRPALSVVETGTDAARSSRS